MKNSQNRFESISLDELDTIQGGALPPLDSLLQSTLTQVGTTFINQLMSQALSGITSQISGLLNGASGAASSGLGSLGSLADLGGDLDL